MNRIGLALFFGVALTTSGCYTWHEIAPTEVVQGMDVRATLERGEALRRLEEAGDAVRMTVSGTVAEQPEPRVLALTTRVRGSAFNRFESIPWSGVLRVEEKRFSWVRTGGVAALGLGATVAILAVIEGQTDDQSEGPPVDEQWIVRIPLLTIGR